MFNKMLCMWTLMFVVAVCEATNGKTCCLPGQIIVLEKNENCWDNVSDKIFNMTLKEKCENPIRMIENRDRKFVVNNEGKIGIKRGPQYAKFLHTESACITNITKKSEKLQLYKALYICEEEEDTGELDLTLARAGCMLTSGIFLFLTAFIYISLSELRDLQGWSIISLCIAFGISLTIMAVLNMPISYEDMTLCAIRGHFAYFFTMASFLWMNSISFQVLRNIKQQASFQMDWKVFLYYSLYSWGTAAALTTWLIVAEQVPGDHAPPGIGFETCWFFGEQEQWMYMYYVLIVLIVANVCIFSYCSILLWRHTFQSSNIRTLRFKCGMLFRLFVVMGVAWIFEIVSSAYAYAYGKSHILLEILDIYNALQGLLIFLILVVFRRRVLKAMYRHGWLSCIDSCMQKYLAKVDDQEDDIVEHTAVPMDDKI